MVTKKAKAKREIVSFCQTVNRVFVDYGGQSTIHGVSYIAEKGRSGFEKFWWITVFCASLLCCGKLIFDATLINPIIISFTPKPTPIWDTPFPAITICPFTFVKTDRINLTNLLYHQRIGRNYFKDLTAKEQIQMVAKHAMCDIQEWIDDVRSYTDCNECLKYLREIRVPLDEIFVKCKFRNQEINCRESFIETILDERYCYTFNEMGVYRQVNESNLNMDWSVDDGYKATATFDAYPHRALGAGVKFGFSILLRYEKNKNDKICTENDGFMLEFRMPYESPQFSAGYFEILEEVSVNFAVTPKIMTTSDELRDNYVPTERGCYFTTEKRLKYFRQYTQSNCEIECQVDIILKTCGCLPIFIEGQRGVDICGPALHNCLMLAQIPLVSTNYAQCHCLPSCVAISFDSEVSRTSLNMSTWIGHVDNYQKEYYYSEVKLFFKENQFLTQERQELYGIIDFLANCGGLLGLCLGVSVISLLEVVYFCTVRLWLSWRDRNSNDIATVEDSPRTSSGTKRFRKIIKDLTVEYASKTTIQGINYAFESTLTRIERVWWTIVVVISAFCCGSLILDVYKQYDESPVIISFANEETPVSHIPFPAVTICPQYISRDIPAMFDYFKVQNLSLYDLSGRSYNMASVAALVCDSGIFDDIDPDNKTDCDQCAKHLKSLMGDVNRVFYFCNHIYIQNNCRGMFQPVVSDEGVCFVYNTLQVFRNFNESNEGVSEEWTLDGGYKNKTEHVDVHPRAGSKRGLQTLFNVHRRLIDGLCKDSVESFKVYLHLPNEAPQISNQFFIIPYQYDTVVMISPKVTSAVPELRDISVAKRQCFFSDERYLRFFQYYTQNNCEIECLVNLTLKRCGCLRIDMPKTPSGERFCGLRDKKCVQLVIRENMEANINRDHSSSSSCRCLQTCNFISYDTEINHKVLPTFNNLYKPVSMNLGFRSNQFVATMRSQLFGTTELIANWGGLLGLFLGFSVISILELIYFCTIRLICNLKMQVLAK